MTCDRCGRDALLGDLRGQSWYCHACLPHAPPAAGVGLWAWAAPFLAAIGILVAFLAYLYTLALIDRQEFLK